MFSAITIGRQNRQGKDRPIDIGYLLECLLFYKKVNVLANPAILRQLLAAFGVDLLEELLKQQCLNILFQESLIGIHTSTVQGIDFHSPVVMSSRNHTLHETLQKQLIAITGKAGKGRRIAARLERSMTRFQYINDVTSGVDALLLDAAYTQSAAKSILSHLVPELPASSPVGFMCEKTEKGFVVHSNLDWKRLNAYYHKRISIKDSSLTPGFLLALIAQVEGHLYTSARQMSELAIDPIGADLVRHRFVHLANRCKQSEKTRTAFGELVLNEAKAIRETFNQNKLPMRDVVKVIIEASKFKDWLSKQDPDVDILREYYREVTKASVIDRLPGKSCRWLMFMGLGQLADSVFSTEFGKAIGLSLGVMDTFFFEGLIKGWRPNQFIAEHLQPLLLTEGAPRPKQKM